MWRGFLQSIWLYRLIRVFLGGMFLVAGIIKLTQPEVFAVTIDAFGLTPEEWSMPAAYLLPLVEIFCGVGLMLDLRWSLSGAALLDLFFMAVILYALNLGLDIDCGCYGPADPQAKAFGSLKTSLWRDMGLMACAVYLFWYRRCKRLPAL